MDAGNHGVLIFRAGELGGNQAQHNLFAFGHTFQRLKAAGALVVKLQIESIRIFLGKQEPNMFPSVGNTLLPLSLLKL